MAIRVYKDPEGGEWRVWRVVPDTISFATLDESYREGWLCFERVSGGDRRRLSMARVPAGWDGLADDRLDALRVLAEPAALRAATGTHRAGGTEPDHAPRGKKR